MWSSELNKTEENMQELCILHYSFGHNLLDTPLKQKANLLSHD